MSGLLRTLENLLNVFCDGVLNVIVYEIELRFCVGERSLSMDDIDDKLYEAGFGDALVGHGGEGIFVISHACHFGGALAGWVLARKFLVPGPSLADLQRDRARREAEMELGDTG